VVALTAHATGGDREKCLSAGCTEYLAKPFDRDEMLCLLARLLGGIKPLATAEPDLEGLRWEYLERVEKELCAMKGELADGELPSAARRAHSLRGSGGTYGFVGISRGASELEQACNQGNRDEAVRALEGLREHLKTLGADNGPSSHSEGAARAHSA
jgi:HPt (histidine-containing phosphotransfer) domain-containing protein